MPIKPILDVIKNSLDKQFTIEFPEDNEEKADNYKGLHRLDLDTCISCAACQRICPNQTIEMVEVPSKGNRKMPQINWERCLFCALCEEVCPVHCLILTKDTQYEVYDRRDLLKRPEELR
ncbi:MAG: NADH-quinone oxidoreductase subunit I [Candidatus Micrarchaeota archaeon]|nr:MAG: NADH-quinone oxidoreductase subunit I [Candidatus Micrarchaeota archaeon]